MLGRMGPPLLDSPNPWDMNKKLLRTKQLNMIRMGNQEVEMVSSRPRLPPQSDFHYWVSVSGDCGSGWGPGRRWEW